MRGVITRRFITPPRVESTAQTGLPISGDLCCVARVPTTSTSQSSTVAFSIRAYVLCYDSGMPARNLSLYRRWKIHEEYQYIDIVSLTSTSGLINIVFY